MEAMRKLKAMPTKVAATLSSLAKAPSSDQPQAAGELDVWVTYDPAPEGAYFPELHNGFRTSIWGNKGYAAALLFVEIEAEALMPGHTKRVRVYTLNPGHLVQWMTTETLYWGPLKRPFGTLALTPPAGDQPYQ
jgi:hypothetical protein